MLCSQNKQHMTRITDVCCQHLPLTNKTTPKYKPMARH